MDFPRFEHTPPRETKVVVLVERTHRGDNATRSPWRVRWSTERIEVTALLNLAEYGFRLVADS